MIGSNVDRSHVITVHELHQPAHAVGGELETPCRAAVAVYDERSAVDGGRDEVGHGATVSHLHVRSIGVEYPGDADLELVLGVVGVGEGLCDAFTLVVAGSRAEGVDVAAVLLGLGAGLRVSVNL